jgi:hypothetical protein
MKFSLLFFKNFFIIFLTFIFLNVYLFLIVIFLNMCLILTFIFLNFFSSGHIFQKISYTFNINKR